MELCKVESEELSEDLSQDDSEMNDVHVSNFVTKGIEIGSVVDSDGGQSQNMKQTIRSNLSKLTQRI